MHVPKYRNLMGLHQLFGSLQHALVLAADQYQAARVMQLDQIPDELDPIHFGHIKIQEEERGAYLSNVLKRGATIDTGWHGRVPEIRHNTAQQLQHEGV